MEEGLCQDCVKGNRLSGTPQGTMVETPTLPAYFSPGNGGDGTQKVIICVSYSRLRCPSII
jgi:hypothetical protein